MKRTLDQIRGDLTHLQRTSLIRTTAEVVSVDRTTDPVRVTVKYGATHTATPTLDCLRSVTPEPGETVQVVATAAASRGLVVGIISAATWHEPEYENSWAAYTADGHEGMRWRYEPGRVVRLDGAVTGGTLAATIFALPEEARPQTLVTIPAVSNNAFCMVNITAAGEVEHVTGGSNAFVAVSATFAL